MPGNFQSWDFDAPTGAFKSHALSQRVLHAAIANTQFMAFVTTIDGYGKNKGETVTIPRFSNLTVPDNGRINEHDDIPEDTVSQSTGSVTVSEWGRSIPYSNFNAALSPLDLPGHLRRALERQMRLVMDEAAAAAFKTTLTKYIPSGVAAGTFDTDGTASTAAASNMNFYHLERLRDYAKATIHAEPFADGNYVLALATKGVRGLKQDPKFETWNAYTNREAKVRGEVGILEGCRVVEIDNEGGSTDNTALRNDLGTGSVLGEGLLFGIDSVYMAVAQDPEVIAAKLDPYGRRFGIAWYGILEFGAYWAADSAADGEANIIHITSS